MSNKSGMIAATAIVALLCVFLGRSLNMPGGTAPLHRGPVSMIYWQDVGDRTEGYTQTSEGLPGTSSVVKVKAYATVYPEWVAVQYNRDAPPQFIPRDRILRLIFDREAPDLPPTPATH
jgi:hypothetical protein